MQLNNEESNARLAVLVLILISIFIVVFIMLINTNREEKPLYDGLTPEEYRELLSDEVDRVNKERRRYRD